MKKDIKDMWLKALRSGEYQQTTGALRTTDLDRRPNSNTDPTPEYCCLGVLCDLAVKAGVELEIRDVTNNRKVHRLYEGTDSALPIPVQIWAGLSCDDPNVETQVHEEDDGPDTYALSNLNDDFHYDFYQIADLIEEQL